jgi:hypothetical protein
MFRNRKQRRKDARLGRQTREVANALHELAIQGGPGGLGGHIHRTNDTLPDSSTVERLASLSSVIEGMVSPRVASYPYKLYGIQLEGGSLAISIGIHKGAARLALPPAVSDYVRNGASRPRAVA